MPRPRSDDDEEPERLTAYDRAAQFVPALKWLRGYDVRSWLVVGVRSRSSMHRALASRARRRN